jgi:hypothetical protein
MPAQVTPEIPVFTTVAAQSSSAREMRSSDELDQSMRLVDLVSVAGEFRRGY